MGFLEKSWDSNGKMRGEWVADLGGVSRHIAGLAEVHLLGDHRSGLVVQQAGGKSDGCRGVVQQGLVARYLTVLLIEVAVKLVLHPETEGCGDLCSFRACWQGKLQVEFCYTHKIDSLNINYRLHKFIH